MVWNGGGDAIMIKETDGGGGSCTFGEGKHVSGHTPRGKTCSKLGGELMQNFWWYSFTEAHLVRSWTPKTIPAIRNMLMGPKPYSYDGLETCLIHQLPIVPVTCVQHDNSPLERDSPNFQQSAGH